MSLSVGRIFFWLCRKSGSDLLFREFQGAVDFVSKAMIDGGVSVDTYHGLMKVERKGTKFVATDISESMWMEATFKIGRHIKEAADKRKHLEEVVSHAKTG